MTVTPDTTLTNTGQGVDFAIGGMGFRLAISDERPYERATAQFRKEQFDAAPTVGDQSLSGWWTRGQLSFHMGAGVKYYEVLEGETVLNRFRASADVDVTEPGVVKLAGLREDKAFTNYRWVTNCHNWVDTWFLAVKSDGTVVGVQNVADHSTATEVAIPTSDTQPATCITASLTKAWITNDKKVETWGVGDSAWSVQFTMANRCNNIWYLKGRLWLVDEHGGWYMYPADATGTKTSGDAFAVLNEYPWMYNESGSWMATDAPNGIYIANDRRILLITLDTSTSTPTPMPPVLVAELPENEKAYAISYSLGYLVIATSHGTRFAAIGTNGELVYGPLANPGVSHVDCTQIAVNSSLVMVPGVSEEHGAGVYAFDLAQMRSDLMPAWHLMISEDSTDLGYTGVLASHTGTHFWSSEEDFFARINDDRYSTPELQSTGEVYTGFHRFGTLEPKHFQAVRVRTAGDGGEIDVYLVEKDGAETLLDTLSPGTDSTDIPLGLTETAEMVGLKFVLHRDSLDPEVGPQLLGYQLKALPAPRRQRMIRVPLLLHDVERRGPVRARGRAGSAWERLSALEAMEESGGLFTFQDFRTGEQGLCFVEQVAHVGATPPGERDSGFGGVVTLTLRKV